MLSANVTGKDSLCYRQMLQGKIPYTIGKCYRRAEKTSHQLRSDLMIYFANIFPDKIILPCMHMSTHTYT